MNKEKLKEILYKHEFSERSPDWFECACNNINICKLDAIIKDCINTDDILEIENKILTQDNKLLREHIDLLIYKLKNNEE